MIALSRQMRDAGNSDLPIGTSLDAMQQPTLSRKASSELNLADMHYVDVFHDSASEATSRRLQSESSKITDKADRLVEDIVEYDAVIALKELGTLVARRKGLDGTSFIKSLMAMLSSANKEKVTIQPPESTIHKQSPMAEENMKIADGTGAAGSLPQNPRAQSKQALDQERQRRFSFEIGDDRSQEQVSYQALSRTDSTDSETQSSADLCLSSGSLRTDNGNSTPQQPASGSDFTRPPATMIPSPVQTMGRVRRENSISSIQTTFIQNVQDGRHNSRTSIQTAFGEGSSANTSIKSKSRSSSNQNLLMTQSPSSTKRRRNSCQNSIESRNSTTALAAARAAESRSSNISRSNTLLSTATPASQMRRSTGRQRAENDDPNI